MGDFAKTISESFRKTLYNPEIQLLTSEVAEDLGFPISEENFDKEENYLYVVESLCQGRPEFSIIVDGELNIKKCYNAIGVELEFDEGCNLGAILEDAGYDLRYLDLEGLAYEEWYDSSSDEFVYFSDASCTFDRIDLSGVYDALAEDSDRLSIAIRRYEEVESSFEDFSLGDDGDDDFYPVEEEEYVLEEDDDYGINIRDMKYYIEVNSENGKEYFSEELPAFFYEDEDEDDAQLDNVFDLQTLLFRQLKAMKKFGFVPSDQQLESLMEKAASGYPAIIFVTKR